MKKKDLILRDFLIIPYKAITDEELSYLDIKVLGIIIWFKQATKLKKCFLTNPQIADILSRGRKNSINSGSVQNVLAHLEKCKYIKRTFSNSSKKIRTEIIPLVKIADKDKVSSNDGRYHQMMTQVSSNDDTRVPSYDDHNNNIYNNKINIYKPHTQSKKIPEKLVMKIVGYYNQKISKSNTSNKTIITEGTKKSILTILQKVSPLDLIFAIEGFSGDDWQMRENGHRGISWVFRSEGRVLQYLGLFNKNRNDSFVKESRKLFN